MEKGGDNRWLNPEKCRNDIAETELKIQKLTAPRKAGKREGKEAP